VGALLCFVTGAWVLAHAWGPVKDWWQAPARAAALAAAEQAKSEQCRAEAAAIQARPEGHPHEGCATAGYAVHCDLSGHEFRFANVTYAERFCKANDAVVGREPA
jgi:hypothetical protein